MPALSRRRARVRRRHDHEIERRHDEDELAAVAPREVHIVRARAADPPAVAVLLVAPSGSGAPHPGAVDPCFRYDLRTVRRPPAVQVHDAERHHLARRHPHLISAEVDPLSVPRPRAERNAERAGEETFAKAMRARPRRAREDRGQQMRAARAVDHRATRAPLRHHRPVERVSHPVPARHPVAVVVEARGLEPRAHRQQILDRDRALAGVEVARRVRQQLADRLVHVPNLPASDRDPDERRDDALRRALDVGALGARRAAEVVLANQRTTPVHEQTSEPRQRAGLCVCLLQEHRVRSQGATGSDACATVERLGDGGARRRRNQYHPAKHRSQRDPHVSRPLETCQQYYKVARRPSRCFASSLPRLQFPPPPSRSPRTISRRLVMVRRASLLALTLLAVSSASHAAAQSSTAPRQLTAHQQLARDIYKELVEINTTTDATPGGTTQAAEAMAARLRAAGFSGAEVQVLSSGPRDGNLVARLRGNGSSGRKPILLLAHLDVVAALKADWSPDLDPFAFTERDGYFYGRGTADDKAMAAIFVANLIRMKQEG